MIQRGGLIIIDHVYGVQISDLSARVTMQFVGSGGGERKRAAEESGEGSARKRTKDDNSSGNAVAIATGSRGDQEYKIRGTSNNKKQSVFPCQNRSASSPVATEPLPSLLSIHPERRANIIRSAVSQSPERVNMMEEPEVQRRKQSLLIH